MALSFLESCRLVYRLCPGLRKCSLLLNLAIFPVRNPSQQTAHQIDAAGVSRRMTTQVPCLTATRG